MHSLSHVCTFSIQHHVCWFSIKLLPSRNKTQNDKPELTERVQIKMFLHSNTMFTELACIMICIRSVVV